MSTPRCEMCGAYLLCKSDAPFGYGAMKYIHQGPCAPKSLTLLDDSPDIPQYERNCMECGESFTTTERQRKICSGDCRNARSNRLRGRRGYGKRAA